MSWEIKTYTDAEEEAWDSFLKEESVNGTFLQSREFLNYHPKERWEDCSLLFYYKDKLKAVCPACRLTEDGKKIFCSHQGSTYGGILLAKDVLRLELVTELLQEMEAYLKEQGFSKIILKPTMSLLKKQQDDTELFAMYAAGFTQYQELNLYLDYAHYDEDIPTNFSKLKRRQVNKCKAVGMELRELTKPEEIADFHAVLSENLLKFDRKPVHTVEELLDLKNNRFPEIIRFFGAYQDGQLMSGTMVFEFPEASCAHTQYLAAKAVEGNASPMSFIYYSMAEYYYEKGYRYLSWGIATEHYGEGVNWGLMRNKEEFGSSHCLNLIYEKEI